MLHRTMAQLNEVGIIGIGGTATLLMSHEYCHMNPAKSRAECNR